MDTTSPLDVNGAISREALYQLVWSEPMLKVAARFGVSSSYMARVCTALNVPRPAVGYWGKAAVGRAPTKPTLPQARPGDKLLWTRGQAVSMPPRFTSQSKVAATPVQRSIQTHTERVRRPQIGKVNVHPMVSGTKAHFEKGRFSHELGYLRPDKKTLVDIIATRATLDRALSFANTFFQALEAKEHRVLFARDYEETQHVGPDVLEEPLGPLGSYHRLWSPGHPTVAYVGTVRFGLTIIEMAEEVQARYVDGKYIRESEYKAPKRRFGYDSTWTTKRQFPTGRLRLQVYSAFRGTSWKRHWDEKKDRPLEHLVDEIVTTLEKSTDAISRLIEESRRKREAEIREWEARRERWRHEEEQRRVAEAHKQSEDELRQLISAWAEAKKREAFFEDAQHRFAEAGDDVREQLLGRVRRGRVLLSSADVLERFARWRSPEERLQRDSAEHSLE